MVQTSRAPPGQTFWLWDLESCSFNQCPRDWSQSLHSERRGPTEEFFTKNYCVWVSFMLWNSSLLETTAEPCIWEFWSFLDFLGDRFVD